MKHLPRLLKIISVAAKYRLDKLAPASGRSRLLGMVLGTLGLPWTGNAVRKLPPAERLRAALEELGPIYIKFGQLLSTRRDFLPHDISEALQSLQDKVPGFSKPGIHEIIEANLGIDWQQYFQHVDTSPLASASIAQVHAATLTSGEEVVIKVLRPNIEQTIRQDIHLLKWVATIIERYIPNGKRLRPREVIADYEHVILGELNLTSEGANASLLRRNFDNCCYTSPKFTGISVVRRCWSVNVFKASRFRISTPCGLTMLT